MATKDATRVGSGAPLRPFKIIVSLVAVVICFATICAYSLSQSRRAVWDRAGDVAASLASMIEADLARNIGTLNLSLQAVADKLGHDDIVRLDPGLRQLVLFDRADAAAHLGAIMVLDETGQLRFDSRTPNPKAEDFSARDYFKAHRTTNAGKPSILYVGHPNAGDADNLFVGISRRLSRADGSFAGVVTGTLQLNYFKGLFANIALSPHSTISLMLADGTVLMLWPYDEKLIGGKNRNAEVLKQLAGAPKGRFEEAATNDARRLVVYSQISDLPIVVSIGQTAEDIETPWRRSALVVALLIAGLCILCGALGFVLFREFARRNAAERKLVTLATTDGLTGLSNRWCFDEKISQEWRRAQQTGAMLALLMIDTDRFKQYNDLHGHQAGDELLKSIGVAVSHSIRSGTDLGARYGGDEFAVLLPETSLEGAARVADQIRAHFAALNEGNASLSVGVACLSAGAATGTAALLTAADNALYRAKAEGRDRLELATAEFRASQDTAIPQTTKPVIESVAKSHLRRVA